MTTATTTAAKKTTVIETDNGRQGTRRLDVYVGSQFRGFVLRNKAEAVWVAYGTGGVMKPLGQSRDRGECVRMVVGG